MALAVSDLPEPDSPTIPTVSPRPTSRSVPTVMAAPGGGDRQVADAEERLCACAWSLRKPLEEPIADQIHADGGEDDHRRRQEQRHGVGEEDGAVLEEHPPPVGRARLDAEAEEGQAGEVDESEGEIEDDVGEDDRQDVRQDMDEEDAPLRDAERPRRVDIGERPLLEDGAPDNARVRRREED